ncbi:leucyl aminopeptidase [Mumia flava]|uniref:Probable cytosol aminopeptidase n=1 Tax=Mumia flava TaxID=1348852 RepID=A0A0B2AY09_9ACTN|nr:leucyl aminopeptidase [Mumia flava]PJJ56088.1 leucyl aminopeptidase [Mumia flava]
MATKKTEPRFTLSSASPTTTRADAVVIAVDSDLHALAPAENVGKAFGRRFSTMLSMLGFSGKPGQVAVIPTQGAIRAGVVIAVGAGSEAPDPVRLRRIAAKTFTAAHNVATLAYALPTPTPDCVRAIAEGALLGGYRFDRYKTSAESASDAEDHPNAVVVLTRLSRDAEAAAALDAGRATASAVNHARDWVNTPPGDLTPEAFADAVTEVAKSGLADGGSVKATVWDEARLAKEKCGGVLAVGQGSASPPRLVTLTYKPRKAVAHLALVGKGITFDSGGLSLKPGASMMTMKCDMAGAASVVAATLAIAAIGLPVQVTCVAPMAENMPSGSALRPGDVITIRGGTTVEIHNTDAEGRLVLADGLRVASEAKPDVLVDVATLTGAAVVALGERTAGVLGNDADLRSRVVDLGESVGEAFWPLPITREVLDKVTSSELADVRQHNPKPAGGTLYAAAFLQQFVDDDTTWAHLDIAGPAFNDGAPYDEVPKGGTGMSVRTLVALAESLADSQS